MYNEKNQLSKVKLNGEVTDSYTYNKTGEVTSHNNNVFTYNQWDTLSSFIDGDATYTYSYDANGIRTQKNNKQYIVDMYNNVVAETDDNGTINAEILWGNNKPLARKIGSAWYYYIYNAHGDVIGLVNESGTVVNSYEYDPWGNVLDETETIDNPIKYVGEYFDDELGMYYLRARYYDPSTGRFTNEDPIKDGLNWYAYCDGNPIFFVDPSGMTYLIAWSYSKADLEPYKNSEGKIDWSRFTAENSFARAAMTRKRDLMNQGIAESDIDVQRIDSEKDLKLTWNMWSQYNIVEGLNIYSHGYEGGISVAGGGGEFLASAQKLNWGSVWRYGEVNGKKMYFPNNPYAVFHGCNTANGDFAQNFANTQGVATYAQTGYASFSRYQTWHIPISDGATDGDVYLYHFDWLNVRNADGWGKVFYKQ